MEKALILTNSKYIKQSKEAIAFTSISLAFFFVLYVIPQYFGLPLPIFDLSALRVMLIIMLLFILGINYRQKQFIDLIMKAPYSKVIFPYLIIISYTSILRVDFNAFFYPVIEFISFYILVYVIKNCFGVKKTLNYIILFSYLITILGLMEYVLQRSPFSYMEIIKGLYTGRYIRSGNYRIMGPMNHSLTYGLMLITMVPIICYDQEKEEINLLKNKLLFIMVTINIFLTGSRSTLSIFLLEVVLLALFSFKRNIKRYIFTGIFIATFVTTFFIIFKNSSITHYFLLQITSIIDELLGTAYSIRYGADQAGLVGSSEYRDQLNHIFQVDWLNPLIGKGRYADISFEINGRYIESIDSFYIAEYIRYAYPGMICYIVFLLYFLFSMLKSSFQKKSQLNRVLFVGSLCFCINILWVESFPRYLYILFAIFCNISANPFEEEREEKEKLPSKYIISN